MARQTKVTIETDSLLILKSGRARRAWCPLCSALEEMFPLAEIGVVSNLEQFEVEKWLSSTVLHQLQAADGSTLICLKSLLNHISKPKADRETPHNADQI